MFMQRQSITPHPTPGFSEGQVDGLSVRSRYSFCSVACSKLVEEMSAIGDNAVFEFDTDASDPKGLVPYISNTSYDDETLRKHYLQSHTVVKDWLCLNYWFPAGKLRKLLSKVGSRPLASSKGKAKWCSRPLARSSQEGRKRL